MPSGFRIDIGRARLLCVLLGAGLVVHAARYDFMSDDGFIVLRYAANLVNGHGMVFNPGERVEGFSSWLWLWLVAAAQMVGADPVLAARLLGLAAGVATVWVTFELATRLLPEQASPAWALPAPLIVAANGSFACWVPAGLETALFTLLLTATVWAAVRQRFVALAVLAALCLLTRSEALLLVGVIAVLQKVQDRQPLSAWLAVWALPAATIVAQFGVRWFYFADLLPNTFYAKTGGTWAQWSRGSDYVLDYAADHESAPLLAALVGFGLLSGTARVRLVAGVVAATWASVIAVGGDGLPMYRFMLPALPLTAVLLAVALERAQRLMASAGLRLVPGVAIGAIVLCVAWAHFTPPERGAHFGDYWYQRNVEVPRWIRTGLWLRDNAAASDSFAAVPIGAVAYYSGLRAYDMLGLTDRHIAHRQMPAMGQGMAGHEKHDGAYILSQRPTFLLLGNIDITPTPRDLSQRPFIVLTNPNIAEREQDILGADSLDADYQPRSVQLGPNEYLNLYQRRQPRAQIPGRTPGDETT